MKKRNLAIFFMILSLMSIIFFTGEIRGKTDITTFDGLRFPLESLAQEEEGYIEPVNFIEVFERASNISLFNTVYEISNNIGPRPYGTEANTEAWNWINTKLKDYYDNDISVFGYGEYWSLIGLKNGIGSTSDTVIGFSAHFDSVPGSPGADDNGSGTALYLEIARILSHYNVPITIVYLGCNAEEIGLRGSYEMGSFIKDFLDPQIIINADMILNDHPVLYHMASEYPYEEYLYFADLIDAFSQNYARGYLTLEETTVTQNYWMYSDQYSFYRHGIPSMAIYEDTMSPYYHSSEDIANQSEYNYN
ncbi:MAG: M28 family metallopeptidase, partial [Candidatus Hodarchaeales archaeon]